MNILTAEFLAIIGVGLTIVAVGAALSTQLFFTTRRIDAYRGDASADRRALQAEAAADRRAFQADAAADRRAFQADAAADRKAFQSGMDEFRREMDEFRRQMGEFRREILRLSERQSRLEGVQEAQASGTTAGS